MNFASARGPGAVVLAALVLVACSSSSSTSPSTGESSADSGVSSAGQDGASSAASGYDAAVDYDAAVAACASYPAAQRVSCCEREIPRGYLLLHVAQEDCVCGSNGPCTSACNYQDCISVSGSTPTCQSCLDTNLAGSCKSTVDSACGADPGCVAYEACLNAGVS